MVTEFGMSERLGTVAYGKKEEMVFLGREISEQRNYSEEVAVAIDTEVKALLDEAYQRASDILTEHLPQVTRIVEVLMERETIDGAEIDRFFAAPKPAPRLVGPPAGEPAIAAMRARPAAERPAPERPERPEPDAPAGGHLRPQPALD